MKKNLFIILISCIIITFSGCNKIESIHNDALKNASESDITTTYNSLAENIIPPVTEVTTDTPVEITTVKSSENISSEKKTTVKPSENISSEKKTTVKSSENISSEKKTTVKSSENISSEKKTTVKPSFEITTANNTKKDIYSLASEYSETYSSYINKILELTNVERTKAGVSPLSLDSNLTKAACHRSIEMDVNNYFAHTRPDGTSCFSIFVDYSVSYYSAGENIGRGQLSPEEMVNDWVNSPKHYQNMISPDFKYLGVGYSPERRTWTQLFCG